MKFKVLSFQTLFFALAALFSSYYIIMGRQNILLSNAIKSSQFWLMLALGVIGFFCYFKYSSYINDKLEYNPKYHFIFFLILRFTLGVFIPSYLILFFLKELFSLLGIDFYQSGYLDTEYYILMIILYSTTIAYIAVYFYERYLESQESINNLLSKSSPDSNINAQQLSDNTTAEKDLGNLETETETEIDSIRNETFKRELADMLLHVVLIRKRKNNTLIFRDSGTCELFVKDPKIIDLFIQECTILQINRWYWVNGFYIHDINRINNEDCIILAKELQYKYENCKTFQESNFQSQIGNKSNLVIGRPYKNEVKDWFQNRFKDKKT